MPLFDDSAHGLDSVRLCLDIEGTVQGVGFRPFVYRLANDLQLAGWVANTNTGVTIEAEGPDEALESFQHRLVNELPPRSTIYAIQVVKVAPQGGQGFEIRSSTSEGAKTAVVLPDIATCADCQDDVFTPGNRRYLYPFTNCTNCGPRFTIIQALPYDRPNTSMQAFTMCPECQAEYDDPTNRRFHAQPNACPVCGPRVALCDNEGKTIATGHDAIVGLANILRGGLIAAVKGIGGFHLMVDARKEESVRRLRRRKQREAKPLAVMFPNLDCVEELCIVTTLERNLLQSPEAPIVLLQRSHLVRDNIAASVAPNNPYLGAMLPYSPLHHILMREFDAPVVATSGNASDEPICIDEQEALERLGGIADVFLVHDRPIVRHCDDSVARIVNHQPMVIRRARGYAPLPFHVERGLPALLGVGAHLKNTISVACDHRVFCSQHIGDLETPEAVNAFRATVATFEQLYEHTASAVACDMHPDYKSSDFARSVGLPVLPVQHHYAHVLSCMVDNTLEAPVLGVAWDGTGLGPDGTIWGGEFLRITDKGFDRVAHLRTFRLPGGDRAIQEPRRAAIGLLYELLGTFIKTKSHLTVIQSFSERELQAMLTMLERNLNSPQTSSAGRLFDAVAALTQIRHQVAFEGQAAMELEFALDAPLEDRAYSIELRRPKSSGEPVVIDWQPMIFELIADVQEEIPVGRISARFHNALTKAIVQVARFVGEKTVALSGGCFQNRYLLERTIRELEDEGFRPFWNRTIPTNDNGISVGQILAAARKLDGGE